MLVIKKYTKAIFKRAYKLSSLNYSKYAYRAKVNNLVREEKAIKLSKNEKQQIFYYFDKFKIKISTTKWHQLYWNYTQKKDPRYIPEDLFYNKIEPTLNNREMYPALEDKNLTEIIFSEFKQPKTILKSVNNFYHINGEQYTKKRAIEHIKNHSLKEFIIKKTIYSYGGNGVVIFKILPNGITDYKNKTVEEIFNEFGTNFIIQKIVDQNEYLKSLNETSLNTLRVTSYLREEEVVILASAIRIGGKNQKTDNVSGNGVGLNLNLDGTVESIWGDVASRMSKDEYEKIKIPFHQEMLEFAKKMHNKIPYFRIISWDIALDIKNEPILIELNAFGQDINGHQCSNGPLFGKYTDEVLNLVSK